MNANGENDAYTAKEAIGEGYGFATLQGKRYLLVGRRCFRNPRTGERTINAVEENAPANAGYAPMMLLHVGKSWKPGEEAVRCEPNGEYDWVMGEQKGWLTPHMTATGGRCHDE